ncbi:MAG: plasmid maintenance system antidote protein [Bacteroidia bacterium]|jgi:plasmid maintenance system antidote protein VapI|nr:plasmid maintenance system antidote protein [Bacteroidia bacterium]
MTSSISILKGLHPGIVLERELKIRQLPKGRFAMSIQEFPQTLVSITKGKRRMNTNLSLKIEKALQLEEGFFMLLQVYYDIAEEKKKQQNSVPDISKLRPALFWDTRFDKIDWVKQKTAVLNRVNERGNEQEKQEIDRFYSNLTEKKGIS